MLWIIGIVVLNSNIVIIMVKMMFVLINEVLVLFVFLNVFLNVVCWVLWNWDIVVMVLLYDWFIWVESLFKWLKLVVLLIIDCDML